MFLRRAILAASLALLPGLAMSADAAKSKAIPGEYVDLMPVGLPIVAKGELVNYVFVYVRINLTRNADTARLRDKEPFFRDALVRAGHRTPFTLASDYSRIDTEKLATTLQREASAITGGGQILSVVVTSQSPRHRVRTPRA